MESSNWKPQLFRLFQFTWNFWSKILSPSDFLILTPTWVGLTILCIIFSVLLSIGMSVSWRFFSVYWSCRTWSLYLKYENITHTRHCEKHAQRIPPGSDVGSAQALIAWPHGTNQIQSAETGCRKVVRERKLNYEGGSISESLVNDEVVQTLELRLQNWQEKGDGRSCYSCREGGIISKIGSWLSVAFSS